MRSCIRVILITCCVGLTVQQAQAQRALSRSQLPTRQLLDRFGLEMMWWGHATINPSRDRVRHFVADEETVYVQSTAGTITAFDSETGRQLWAQQIGIRDATAYPIVTNDRLALVSSGMQLYAINKWTGKILWRIKLPGLPSTSPSADDEQLYFGTLDGSVYALSLDKINELYSRNLLPQWSEETFKWRYQTGDVIVSPPLSTGRIVNFASKDRSLYSVAATTRDLQFQFEVDDPLTANIGQSGKFLYLATGGDRIFCVNRENGAVRWEYPTGLPILNAPVVLDNAVYIFPSNGGMFSLSALSGRQNWWRGQMTAFIAASRNRVYVTDENDNIGVLTRDNGQRIGLIRLNHFTNRISNERTDRIFLATDSGMIACLREKGQEFPVYHKYPDRRPIMPEFVQETAAPPDAQPPDISLPPDARPPTFNQPPAAGPPNNNQPPVPPKIDN